MVTGFCHHTTTLLCGCVCPYSNTIWVVYVDTYDDTTKEIEQIKNYKPLEDGSDVVDPYMIVMNKDHDGYRRPYGRDITNRLIKRWVVVMHRT
ncbi:unnamed protein product [Lactuca virosa]|uniref:Uncharacterized protein n=1 Tax=Lactuca virosa TaxID=75947 RepID=A0AAU9P985_9ASTR|nr:unnamed protein product [Lactuca virosa]